jgi:Fe-S-cluster containining protein
LDGWFRSVLAEYSKQMQCGRGCARCCHGLFDISLPDALGVVEGFCALREGLKAAATGRALDIHSRIIREIPELEEPYLLSEIAGERIDQGIERIGDVRCPLLDEQDACLIYNYRPLACRLEGIPIVDARDGLFGDWCELNFKEGISREIAEDLRLDYNEIQAIEREVTSCLSPYFGANPQKEATLFIPSVIAAVETIRALNPMIFEP